MTTFRFRKVSQHGHDISVMNLLVLADDDRVRHDLTAQPADLVLALGDDLSGLLLCGGSQKEAVTPALPAGSLSVSAAAATVIAAAVIASPVVAATVIASVVAAIITPPESEAERY